MRASGSHAFSVDGAWVDAGHAFDIDPARATAPGSLYRFPFASLAFVTIAANISGMALHFLELAAALLARRAHPANGQPLAGHPEVANAQAAARAALEAARSHFYNLLEQAWQATHRGETQGAADTHALHAASLTLVNAARKAVDDVFPYCGLVAVNAHSDIGRAWRDLHTGTQHAMLLPLVG
jgi:alkylation response protein AidB-like acyl-CoA dehydrogenase